MFHLPIKGDKQKYFDWIRWKICYQTKLWSTVSLRSSNSTKINDYFTYQNSHWLQKYFKIYDLTAQNNSGLKKYVRFKDLFEDAAKFLDPDCTNPEISEIPETCNIT